MDIEHSNTRPSRLQMVSRASSQLSKFMPEVIPGEHLSRAEMLSRTGVGKNGIQFFEITFFMLSNNHVDTHDSFSDARLLRLIKSFQPMELLLRALFDSKLISAQAVCDQIFGSAIRQGDLDVLSVALKVGFDPNQGVLLKYMEYHPLRYSMSADQRRPSGSPLQIALCNRRLECCKLLLSHGANRTSIENCNFPMIACAVGAYDPTGPMSGPFEGGEGHRFSSDDLEVLQAVLSWYTEIPMEEKRVLQEYRDRYFISEPVLMLLDPYLQWSQKVDEGNARTEPQDESSLILAIRSQDIPGITALLNEGTNPNTYSITHQPALYESILIGRLDICQMLLAAGASLSLRNPVGDILGFASFSRQINFVQLLLERGADVNAKTSIISKWFSENGISPYIYEWLGAYSYRNSSKFLRDPKMHRPRHFLVGRRTALFSAIYFFDIEMSHLLLEYGAVVACGELALATRNIPSVLPHMFENGAYFDLATDLKESILGGAIRTLQFDLVTRIIESDRFQYDPWALCAAVWVATKTKDLNLVDALLSKRNTVLPETDVIEGTALGIAIKAEDWGILKLFHTYKVLPALSIKASYKHEPDESLKSWAKKGGW